MIHPLNQYQVITVLSSRVLLTLPMHLEQLEPHLSALESKSPYATTPIYVNGLL
jgi:hypothetical protein